MSANPSPNLLSGRAKDRLSQLQRSLANEYRALSAQQSLLLGALQACDLNTQNLYLQEYLERVTTLLATMMRLRAFVARHCASEQNVSTDENFNGDLEQPAALS